MYSCCQVIKFGVEQEEEEEMCGGMQGREGGRDGTENCCDYRKGGSGV